MQICLSDAVSAKLLRRYRSPTREPHHALHARLLHQQGAWGAGVRAALRIEPGAARTKAGWQAIGPITVVVVRTGPSGRRHNSDCVDRFSELSLISRLLGLVA